MSNEGHSQSDRSAVVKPLSYQPVRPIPDLQLCPNVRDPEAKRSRVSESGVDVDENVWGNGKERRPPSVGRQNGGRHFSAWLVPPDSLTTIGRCCGRWRLGKSGGADIMVAKEAGR